MSEDIVKDEVVETTEPIEEAAAPVVEETEAKAEDVISVDAPEAKEEQALAPVKDGVIGVGTKEAKAKKPAASKVAETTTTDKVAVFSEKNVLWEGVGTIKRGYNVFSKSVADKWLARSYVRLATPEEVKKAFGK